MEQGSLQQQLSALRLEDEEDDGVEGVFEMQTECDDDEEEEKKHEEQLLQPAGDGATTPAAEAAAPPPRSPGARSSCSSAEEADDMTCAICLDRTQLVEIALVKGCEHQYCVNCILQWSLVKETCPQCKQPFDYLLTHKQLDGSLTDYLAEESVVLLKRARWFSDYMRDSEKGRAMMAMISGRGGGSAASAGAAAAAITGGADTAAAAAAGGGGQEDWADLYEDYLDAELEEDEEIESYYFSSAAGRARVVLGNRRWGEGGFMRAGRMYARPVVHNAQTGGGKGKQTSKAGGSKGASSSSAAAAAGSSRGGGAGSSSAAAAASSAGGCGASSSSGSNARGGRSSVPQRSAQGDNTNLPPWLVDDDDDDDDFAIYDTPGYTRGSSSIGGGRRGGSGSAAAADGSGGASSRSRSRGMIKPLRQVPKGAAVSPALATATCPVVDTPLGRSPASSSGGGLHIGSWGAAGKSPNSCGGMWAAAAAAASPGTAGSSSQAGGSAPGSGRRARRNARRAAIDAD